MKKIMHKLLITMILTLSCSSAFAAKIPDDIREYIDKKVPGTDIRFDGVIILPDNTIYLPLFPSLFSDVKSVEIKELLRQALTSEINNRVVYMKGIDASYSYEGYFIFKTEDMV